MSALHPSGISEPSHRPGTYFQQPICPQGNLIIPTVTFTSPEQLLGHVTRNWRKNFVTVDLTSSALVDLFAKRPFFILVNVDAPLLQRYHRSHGYGLLNIHPDPTGKPSDQIFSH